jgi:hypothetical protein
VIAYVLTFVLTIFIAFQAVTLIVDYIDQYGRSQR